MKKPTILIVNDDSIHSRGIDHLVCAVDGLGVRLVVAPDKPCSGKGHAATIAGTVYAERVQRWKGVESYACSGTPVDCVKYALTVICKDNLPDICLSGINHGANHTLAVYYSGTLGAATEARFYQIPAIGFSFMEEDEAADFTQVKTYVRKITEQVLQLPEAQRKDILLNVNFPFHNAQQPLKGVRVVRQGKGQFFDIFQPISAQTQPIHYSPRGWFKNDEPESKDTDFCALDAGYVSVVPLHIDRTHYPLKEILRKLWDTHE